MSVNQPTPADALLRLPVKAPNVIEKKLGRYRVHGFADYENQTVEIDTRLKGQDRLEILCHELLHIAFPYLAEHEIARASKILGQTLHHQGYRKEEE